jgi:hypothetical protein
MSNDGIEINSPRDLPGEFVPSLPYAGTEGYAGSDTSKAQAQHDAVSGVASKRQRYVLIMAARAGEKGITVAELRDQSLHHGRISGALSVLHKEGRLARLTEIRDKCKVYVLPKFVGDRATENHGVIHRADKETVDAATTVENWLRRNEDLDALFDYDAEDPIQSAIWRLVNYAQGRT